MKLHTHTVEHTIWKLLPGTFPIVLLECRDANQRQVYFSAFDLKLQKKLWEIPSPLNPWWTSLKDVSFGHVVLIRYPQPDMPETKGLAVLNEKNGALQWIEQDLQYLYAEKEGVIVSQGNESEVQYRRLAWHTGHVIGAVSMKELFKQYNKKELHKSVQYPYHFDNENEFYPQLKTYIEQIHKESPVSGMEYLEIGDKVIISYYLCTDSLYTNKLSISDNSSILYQATLSEDMKGVAWDTFFVQNNVVVVVQNLNQIISIEL
ncbi:MAG: DUF4905 domain-containing protein [Cytophagaceae bacterium]|jgi:hypothetical protein|nr:DUF4905 domain-containing protein [Cytophagaceae bacterium]